MTPDTINDLRRRILAGEDIPPAELAEAILALRTARTGATIARAERAAAKASPIDLSSLFPPSKEPLP